MVCTPFFSVKYLAFCTFEIHTLILRFPSVDFIISSLICKQKCSFVYCTILICVQKHSFLSGPFTKTKMRKMLISNSPPRISEYLILCSTEVINYASKESTANYNKKKTSTYISLKGTVTTVCVNVSVGEWKMVLKEKKIHCF